MRLDEWQKYIDTQFLADEPAEVKNVVLGSVSVPSGLVASEIVELAPAHSLPAEPAKTEPAKPINENPVNEQEPSTSFATQDPNPDPNIVHHSVNSMLTVVVSPPAGPIPNASGRAPRIELLTPLPEPAGNPILISRIRDPIQDPVENPISSKITTSASIKTGQENTNRTRRRSQNLPAQSYVNAPASNNPEASNKLFRPLTDLETDIPAFQNYLPSSHAAARSAEIDTVQQPALLPDNPDIPELTTAKSIRRIPGTRAKNARNVRPDVMPSNLSAAELWAQVPRHVQTLLSLERLEENEVAQFSYKRPFQEKRHELIERLLDPILSLEDTARLLNVCPTTVRRYTNKGILTHYRKEPERVSHRLPTGQIQNDTPLQTDKETRQRRFRLSDILTFLETQRAAIEADRSKELD